MFRCFLHAIFNHDFSVTMIQMMAATVRSHSKEFSNLDLQIQRCRRRCCFYSATKPTLSFETFESRNCRVMLWADSAAGRRPARARPGMLVLLLVICSFCYWLFCFSYGKNLNRLYIVTKKVIHTGFWCWAVDPQERVVEEALRRKSGSLSGKGLIHRAAKR